MTLGIDRMVRRRGALSKLLAGLFLAFCLASCLFVRFAARHLKDDYRGAALIAKSAVAAGQQVWWNADEAGAAYYGVAGNQDTILVVNRPLADLRMLLPPDVVIVSKPDTFDNGGGVAQFLRDEQYQITEHLPAFTIWKKPP
jgi:hypothetical protein